MNEPGFNTPAVCPYFMRYRKSDPRYWLFLYGPHFIARRMQAWRLK